MRKINYSKFDLEKFSLAELQRICRYYGIEYRQSWSKAKLRKEILAYAPVELIEKTYNQQAIYEMMNPGLSVVINTEPIKSVRIQRIEERKTKNGD